MRLFLFLFIINNFLFSQKLLPVDESEKNHSFSIFKKQLINAIEKRDSNFIYGILDSNVINSLGGDIGIDNFKKLWDLSNVNSPFWHEMREVISLGGNIYEEMGEIIFLAPYVYSMWNEKYDPFDYVAVIKDNAELMSEPDDNSYILKILSYDILRFIDFDVTGEWVNVETLSKNRGWIRHEEIRSPLNYRAEFILQNGKWSLVFFASGD